MSVIVGLDGRVTYAACDVPARTHARYLQLHALVPDGVATWSPGRVAQEVEAARAAGTRAAWERALLLLAHHQSQLACDILGEIEEQVPPALRGIRQLALGEALGWLGYNYLPDEAGRLRAVPAGAPPRRRAWPN